MGNSSEKQRKKRCAESKFRWTIQEFLERYGKLSKEQAREWVNKTYSDNLYSITKTNFAAPSTRKSKEELLDAFQKAYDGKWSASLIEIRDVTYTKDKEIIEWKMKNNVPSSKNQGQRVNLFFKVVSTFDRNTSLWLSSSYDQYVPQAALPPPIAAPSYPQSTGSTSSKDPYEDQKRRAAQQAEEDARRTKEAYEAREKQFRENMRRQEEQQREYQRQQQLQAEQRAREAQQAAIKNNRW